MRKLLLIYLMVFISSVIHAQNARLTGQVKDDSGDPIPGVNIIVKGTQVGTVTDVEGKFTFTVKNPLDAVLQVSSIGLTTKEIKVGDKTTFSITLSEDRVGMDEVVVVGFGTKTAASLTGAVATVDTKALDSRPLGNVVQGLQGLTSGLNIQRSSGAPGDEGYSINIRGASSLNSGNKALILIDGIEGDLSIINPNDIANVSVLKDASAAIYGARAAGGVVLITTKKGRKSDKVNVSLSSSYTITKAINIVEKISTRDWIITNWEAETNNGGNPAPKSYGVKTLEEALSYINTGKVLNHTNGGPNRFFFDERDWEDDFFQNGYQQNHNISINGGTKRTSYNFSLGYVDEEGILKDAYNNSERYNLRMNYEWDITDKLSVNANLSYAKRENQSPVPGVGAVVNHYQEMYSWMPEYTRDGNEYYNQDGFLSARSSADKKNGISENTIDFFTLNLKGKYEIIDGLNLNVQYATNRNKTDFRKESKIIRGYGYEGDAPAFLYARDRNYAERKYSSDVYTNVSSYLEFNKTFGDHTVGLTFGGSHEEKDFGSFDASRKDFTQETLMTLNLGNAKEQYNGESASDWAIRSIFGRASYEFQHKYIAEFNFRRDGTSVFHPDERWGNFYGASLGYRLSEEDFIKKLGIFSNLKLRASRGTTGNQNLNTGNLYDYIALIHYGGMYPFGDGALNQRAYEKAIVSNSRTWEDVTTTNFGIDFGVLEGRLSGSFDYFVKNNDNMLLGVNVPAVLGGGAPAQNIGELETKGWELSLTWADKTDFGLKYSITGAISDDENELIDLDGRDQVGLGLNKHREGYAMNTYFAYDFDGIIQTEEELKEYKKLDGVPTNLQVGDVKFRDINGDGKISVTDNEGNDADIINLGENQMHYSYSIRMNAEYKGFDLSMFWQGVGERTMLYTGSLSVPWVAPWRPPTERFIGKTWRPDRTNAEFPRLTTGPQNGWNYSTSKLQEVDGSYLRLKNITLGYTLPKKWVSFLNIQSLRLYVSGEDILTFTDLEDGYDPEVSDGGHSNYPFLARYSFGVNINF